MNRTSLKLKLNEETMLIIWSFLFIALLLFRDVFSLTVDKYIFVILVAFFAFSTSIKKNIEFAVFLFPLFVGLPNNLIVFMLLIRFLIAIKEFKISAGVFFAFALSAVVLFLEGVMAGTPISDVITYIYELLCVFLLLSYQGNIDIKNVHKMYLLGVMATAVIMLVSTLRVYNVSDLFMIGSRMGTRFTEYTSSSMKVSIDPNYMGYFCITAISTSLLALGMKIGWKDRERILNVGMIIITVFITLIGLSRAFILVLFLFLVCFLLTKKRFNESVALTVLIPLLIFLLFKYAPNLRDSILYRFREADILEGNGRISIILRNYNMWKASFKSLILGTGYFNCNVHCMPLQLLFGGGIAYFLTAVYSFAELMKTGIKARNSEIAIIPLAVCLLMSATIPVANNITFMFPVFYSILHYKLVKRHSAMEAEV